MRESWHCSFNVPKDIADFPAYLAPCLLDINTYWLQAWCRWLVWAHGTLTHALQRCEVAAIGAVRDVLEAAPTDSLRLRTFAALLAGPLRRPVLRFYAQVRCARFVRCGGMLHRCGC